MSRHPTHSAVFILIEKDDQYFFLRRKDTGWNDGMLTIPSGHIDKGQTARQAAIVEAKEEAGIDIEEEDLEFIFCHYIYDTYTNFYFKAKKWTGEPMLGEPHLCSEVLWIPKNELPNDVARHVLEMFAGVDQGEYFADSDNDSGVSD